MKFLFAICILLLSATVFGQEVSEIPSELNVALTFLSGFMGGFVAKYPVLGDILGYMLTARIIVKPLMSFFISVSASTEIKFLDDIAAYSDSKIYKTVAFVLDWVFSLKLPKQIK